MVFSHHIEDSNKFLHENFDKKNESLPFFRCSKSLVWKVSLSFNMVISKIMDRPISVLKGSKSIPISWTGNESWRRAVQVHVEGSYEFSLAWQA